MLKGEDDNNNYQSLTPAQLRERIAQQETELAEMRQALNDKLEQKDTDTAQINTELTRCLQHYLDKHFADSTYDEELSATEEQHPALARNIGPFTVQIQDASTENSFSLQGLTKILCRDLLENYFGISSHSVKRSSSQTDEHLSHEETTSTIDKILVQGENTEVNLMLGNERNLVVNLHFSEASGLQFTFLPYTSKRDRKCCTPARADALFAKLAGFIDDTLPQDNVACELELFDRSDESHEQKANNSETKQASPKAEDTEEPKARERNSRSTDDTTSVNLAQIASGSQHIGVIVDDETGRMKLYVGERPDTHLGRKQGAHITAYVVYLTAVLEAIDARDIREIPNLLLQVGQLFVSPDRWPEIEEKVKRKIETTSAYFNRDARKQLTSALRAVNMREEAVEIKRLIKVNNAHTLANLIRELSSDILSEINQDETVLYERRNKKTASGLGKEGAAIKAAMKGLRALDTALEWTIAGDTEKNTLKEMFKHNATRHGIKAFLDIDEVTDESIERFFDSVLSEASNSSIPLAATATASSDRPLTTQGMFASQATQNTEEESNSIATKASNLVYDLFDLDYFEYSIAVLFDIMLSHTSFNSLNKEQKKTVKELVEKVTKNDPQVLLTQCTNISSDSDSTASTDDQLTSDINILIHLLDISLAELLNEVSLQAIRDLRDNTARHLDFIYQAFPNLGQLESKARDKIETKFKQLAWTKMRWINSDWSIDDVFPGFSISNPEVSLR